MRPDFSPLMLKAFLRVRVDFAVRSGAAISALTSRAAILDRAGVSKGEFRDAWAGRLKAVAPRLKLWAALGLVPGDFGVMLTDDGRQEALP